MKTYTLSKNHYCTKCKIDSVQVFHSFDNRLDKPLITTCTICGETFNLNCEDKHFTSNGKKLTLEEVLDEVWEEDNEKKNYK